MNDRPWRRLARARRERGLPSTDRVLSPAPWCSAQVPARTPSFQLCQTARFLAESSLHPPPSPAPRADLWVRLSFWGDGRGDPQVVQPPCRAPSRNAAWSGSTTARWGGTRLWWVRGFKVGGRASAQGRQGNAVAKRLLLRSPCPPRTVTRTPDRRSLSASTARGRGFRMSEEPPAGGLLPTISAGHHRRKPFPPVHSRRFPRSGDRSH